jgi:hypothetical protein
LGSCSRNRRANCFRSEILAGFQDLPEENTGQLRKVSSVFAPEGAERKVFCMMVFSQFSLTCVVLSCNPSADEFSSLRIPFFLLSNYQLLERIFFLTVQRTNGKVRDSLQSGKMMLPTIFDKRSC